MLYINRSCENQTHCRVQLTYSAVHYNSFWIYSITGLLKCSSDILKILSCPILNDLRIYLFNLLIRFALLYSDITKRIFKKFHCDSNLFWKMSNNSRTIFINTYISMSTTKQQWIKVLLRNTTLLMIIIKWLILFPNS